MMLYRDETFGPVVPVIPFATDDEAIAIANDSEYGLSSGVITRDEARALAIAQRLETGMCHINCSSVNDEPHVPFGGAKSSGVGRHGGRWSTETFTETRWITLDRGGPQQRRLRGLVPRLRGLWQQRGKVVVEDEGARVLRIVMAAGALVPGAQVAGRVVGRATLARCRVHPPLPGALHAMRTHLHPLAGEGIVSAVGVIGVDHGASP